MKKATFLFLTLLFCLNSSAQKLHLRVLGNSEVENKTIDSLNYNQYHTNAKSIVDEVNSISSQLTKIGFIENEIIENKKLNDSTFNYRLNLGNRVDFIHIYVGKKNNLNSLSLFETKNDTINLPYKETETFLKQTLNKLEKKGFALSKIKLVNLKKQHNYIIANLDLQLGQQRQLNGIVIRGYEKFPEGHLKNIQRTYKNKVFNQENLKKIHDDFAKFRFVKQIKYPEILFKKDSTKIYVYLEKTKSNNFDGFIVDVTPSSVSHVGAIRLSFLTGSTYTFPINEASTVKEVKVSRLNK